MLTNYIKQKLKTFLAKVILPIVYKFYCKESVINGLVVFADSNNNQLPYSMEVMYKKMKANGFKIRIFCRDFSECSMFGIIKYMLKFMEIYARAEYVFICNYFLPVNSCNKRKETTVVQLWHSCGLLKKFAYDAKEDISKYYKGSVTKNIDLITVSSDACVNVWQKALRLRGGERTIVKAVGVSRTDVFFDERFNRSCKKEFYEKYPQYKDKKILLWAPTFRGTAADGKTEGIKQIMELSRRLGSDWAVIIKLHPHSKENVSNCDMPCYKLFPCVDLLISDYSSLIFEFAFFRKPIVIFAPDRKKYENDRGLYIRLEEISGEVAEDVDSLEKLVKERYEQSKFPDKEYYEKFDKLLSKHCGACDGNAAQKILDAINCI